METNMIYLRARYYSPGLGRFIAEDPVRDGINWYVYCENNPINYWDPFGLEPKDHFLNPDDVAIDFAIYYNIQSINHDNGTGYFGHEYGSKIYTFVENGVTYYSYTEAVIGSDDAIHTCNPNGIVLEDGQTAYGTIHTHATDGGVMFYTEDMAAQKKISKEWRHLLHGDPRR